MDEQQRLAKITDTDIAQFQANVWSHYRNYGRHDLLWRIPEPNGQFDPYKIVVSELMLQQTQVSRVMVKYRQFLERFPNVYTLATASLGDVLIAWQGLGYNRRAKYLWQMAGVVESTLAGVFPTDRAGLVALPGIGANTAGAVIAYAYDQPVAFVETNIRTVIIHHFFNGVSEVSDRAIQEIVQKVLPKEQTREWYWALMDYGTYIKQTVGNASRTSKVYSKQTPFKGSKRAVRGAIIRQLSGGRQSAAALQEIITDDRLNAVLSDLLQENMIRQLPDGDYSLT